MTDYLLDTQAFLWFDLGDARMPAAARAVVEHANTVFVSAASAWEIYTKHRIGKLPEADLLVADLAGFVARRGFRELPVTFADGATAGAFTQAHKDPFDRMIAAQSINHGLMLVSSDAALDAFGVVRVW